MQPSPATTAGKFWSLTGGTLILSAIGVFWLMLFDEVRGEWQLNPQYSFGWVVPLLCASLLWKRWPERPSPQSPANLLPVAAISVGLVLLILPLRMVLEANPEWRLLYWIHGFQALGFSLCLLYRVGGWPWVHFFTPPLAFILIAIPWPMGMESGLIQGLMRVVAFLTVECAGWLGIPAVQRGNLIEVGVGIVGIDEACSGVNSLQSALMISLFLGEQHRLSIFRRLGLLAGSLVFVILANLTRTTFLVWVTARHGLFEMEKWHDSAGLIVMGVVLSAMFVLAWLIRPHLPANPIFKAPGLSAKFFFPRWVGVTALTWLAVVGLATDFWYRLHEHNLVENPRWSVVWPSQKPQFEKKTIPEKSLAILRCSESSAANWQDEDGNQWSVFFLRWEAGKNSAQLAKGHSPDICFPAAGARLAEDFGRVTLEAKGITLPFRHLSFESGTKVLHVFYCLWSDNASPIEESMAGNGSQASRIEAVLAGRRNLGQQALEVVIQGPDSSAAAFEVFKDNLPNLVATDRK